MNIKTDERAVLTATIMSEFDAWGLTAIDVIQILQLPDGTPKRAMRQYRENTAFPAVTAVDDRLEHIIGIINALRTSYPHNRNMCSFWMKQVNKRFDNQSPVSFLISKDLVALIAIRKHLDCSYMVD